MGPRPRLEPERARLDRTGRRSLGRRLLAFRDDRQCRGVDDRVDGSANRIEPVRRDTREKESQSEAVAWGVKCAVAWMERHAPIEWDHPAVEAVVSVPPARFVLDRYYLEEREQIVYYRQDTAERAVGMGGGRVLDSAASLETRRISS